MCEYCFFSLFQYYQSKKKINSEEFKRHQLLDQIVTTNSLRIFPFIPRRINNFNSKLYLHMRQFYD